MNCFVSGKGVDSIFKKPASLFVKVKVKDLLFNGIPFDCTVKDFAGSAICNVLKTEGIDDLMVDGEGLYRFAIFGPVSMGVFLFLLDNCTYTFKYSIHGQYE